MAEVMIFPSYGKGYGAAGASYQRRALRGMIAKSGSPREDIDLNNQTLRERSRMLYMAAPIASSAIKTPRTNVIGLGLKMNPRIDREQLHLSREEAEIWERNVKAEFSIWADDKMACDATGMNNFYAMQQLAFISWLVSGDVFALVKQREPTRMFPYALRLHLIEADRCATPESTGFMNITYAERDKKKIYDGVEVDGDGMVVAYHFRNKHPYEASTEETKYTRVLAYGAKTGMPNVLHIMNSERPEQYRGVTYLAQIIEPVLQTRRYTESEITAAIVESFFTAFVTTEAEAGELPLDEVGEYGEESHQQVEHNQNEYEMGSGNVVVLKKGEKVDFGDPKRPASGFASFLKEMCTQIGAALEIPRDILMKDFNASYSASRGALLEAWKSFKMYRGWFVDDFCNPVYSIWLSEAVARGRISAPGFFTNPVIKKAWLGCEWIGPTQGQLDPVKEVTAEIMSVAAGFSTNSDSTIRINGSDWNQNMDQIQSEIQKKQIVLGEETDGGQKNTAEQITNSVYRAVKDAYKEELRGHGQEGDQDIE
jgi:lambda family phage portal protein